jgi:hypothetical protein
MIICEPRTNAFEPRRSAVGPAGSKPTCEEQHDEDDNDDADDPDAAIAEAVAVAADASAEATEQEHDEDYDEYEPDGHGVTFLSGLPNPGAFISGHEALIDAFSTTSLAVAVPE